ncbi:hypothetical protein [Rubinisphaera margarita]|uniref:hypothetical protein n=1 Tax=Rubinisphaera margarita TaxID=2909586 RepID=UPI001EE887C6|nr:hypothetical protein [Rubinisphaera margarita]MCG6156055.1 hypothetical protein [Rubinisphaera margarita]
MSVNVRIIAILLLALVCDSARGQYGPSMTPPPPGYPTPTAPGGGYPMFYDPGYGQPGMAPPAPFPPGPYAPEYWPDANTPGYLYRSSPNLQSSPQTQPRSPQSQTPRSDDQRSTTDDRDEDDDDDETGTANINDLQDQNSQFNGQNNNNTNNNNSNLQTAQGPSAQSTARPNMIGDYRESPFFYTNGFNDVTLPQQGIVRLDFSQNTNPVPQDRVYLNYHHYRNAFGAQAGVIGNDRLFFGTIEPAGGVADSILIDSISRDEYNEILDFVMGDESALAQELSLIFGFDVFDPNAFLDSDSLVADGFDSANLDIFYLGFEKTFANERASFEIRLPVLSAPNQDLDAREGNLQSLNGYNIEMGNMSLLLKTLLMQDYTGTFTVSGGFGLTIPTGPDFRIRDSNVLIPDQNNVGDATALANLGATPPNFIFAPSDYIVAGGPTGRLISLPGNDITVRNEAVLLTPFLAFSQQLNRKLFTQLYFQGDFVVSENTLSQPDGTTAKIKQQDTLKIDYQMMYWFFRKPDLVGSQAYYMNGMRTERVEGCHFKGLAGLLEFHGTTALIDPDTAGSEELLNDPRFISGSYDLELEGQNYTGQDVDLKTDRFFSSSNNNRRLRSLNITSGFQADFADGGTLTLAVAVPLVQQTKGVNLFDHELIMQYNFYY